MGINCLQNDVSEPVAFASLFSSCIPEGGWVSTLLSVLWRWETSWIFILPSLQKHLCHLLVLWGWRPPILGTPFPHEQPGLGCGKSAGAGAQCFVLAFSEMPGYLLLLGTGLPQCFLWEQFSLCFPACANVGMGSCAPSWMLRLGYFTLEIRFSRSGWS